MPSLYMLQMAALCLVFTASARPRLPVLYLQETGESLELDPRVQRETGAFYDTDKKEVPHAYDPAIHQREVPDSYGLDHGRHHRDAQDFYDDARHQREVSDTDDLDRYQGRVQDFYDAARHQREVPDTDDLDRYQGRVQDSYDAARHQREVPDADDLDRYQGRVQDFYDAARHQREVPDTDDLDRYQGRVQDSYDAARHQREVPGDDGPNSDRAKRKSPLSFLFFEKDGGSIAGQAGGSGREAGVGRSGDKRALYDGYPPEGRDPCDSSACSSEFLAASSKRNGGRFRGIAGVRTFKKRFGKKIMNNPKANKPY